MSLIDTFRGIVNRPNISNQNSDDNETASDLLKDKAVDIVKKLAGGDIKYSRKLVDNVVVFTNASGGTGTSTIAANVASMVAHNNLRVLIIDLNIMYPIQHTFFNRKQEIEKPDLVSYLLGKNPLGDSIETEGKISTMIANNRGLMDSINCESASAVSNFTSTIDQVRQMFDLVIIDAPMNIEHTLVNNAFYISNQIYIVWDESISSISNTERIRRNMLASGIDAYSKMKLILNKKTSVNYGKYPIEKLNLELLEILPFDVSIIESGLRSQIFCEKGSSSSKNASAFYTGIESLTDKILENGGYIK